MSLYVYKEGEQHTIEWFHIWQTLLPPKVLLVDLAKISDEERSLGVRLLSIRRKSSADDTIPNVNVGMALEKPKTIG